MKARVKATGKIVEVTPESYYTRKEGVYLKFTDKEGMSYLENELDFYVESKDLDYWEKILHQYAGMAMQGILANIDLLMSLANKKTADYPAKYTVAKFAKDCAHALVEKLKEEK